MSLAGFQIETVQVPAVAVFKQQARLDTAPTLPVPDGSLLRVGLVVESDHPLQMQGVPEGFEQVKPPETVVPLQLQVPPHRHAGLGQCFNPEATLKQTDILHKVVHIGFGRQVKAVPSLPPVEGDRQAVLAPYVAQVTLHGGGRYLAEILAAQVVADIRERRVGGWPFQEPEQAELSAQSGGVLHNRVVGK